MLRRRGDHVDELWESHFRRQIRQELCINKTEYFSSEFCSYFCSNAMAYFQLLMTNL
jgi:hypothetical protein